MVKVLVQWPSVEGLALLRTLGIEVTSPET